MALSGAKFQEASLGQYGSTYLAGDDDLIDLNENNSPNATRYICSITFLEDTQFQALENLGGEIGSFSDVIGENNLDDTTNGIGASANGTTLTIGASGQVFPKGITVFGRWDFVELHSGACICYFAPV
tara:strand:- start:1915 stop:2298 length:384 start_codon:yes stop_codon:yes gene_type:complete